VLVLIALLVFLLAGNIFLAYSMLPPSESINVNVTNFEQSEEIWMIWMIHNVIVVTSVIKNHLMLCLRLFIVGLAFPLDWLILIFYWFSYSFSFCLLIFSSIFDRSFSVPLLNKKLTWFCIDKILRSEVYLSFSIV